MPYSNTRAKPPPHPIQTSAATPNTPVSLSPISRSDSPSSPAQGKATDLLLGSLPALGGEESLSKERVFVYLLMCQVAVYMEAGAVPALLDHLVLIFDLSYSQQGLLGGSVYLALAAACPVAAWALRKFPAGLVLGSTLSANTLAVLIFATTSEDNAHMLIAARALIGFSQAFLAVYSPLWLDAKAPAEHQTSWWSYLQAASPVGVMFGYLLGFRILAYDRWLPWLHRWRIPFFIQVLLITPLCIAAFFLPAESLSIEESSDSPGKPDYGYGSLTDSPRTAAMQEPVTPRTRWHRSREPLIIDQIWRLIKLPKFTLVVLGLCSLFFVVTGVQFWATAYLIRVLGAPTHQVMAGFVLTAATAPLSGVMFGGYFVDKYCGGYKGEEACALSVRACLGFGTLATASAAMAAATTETLWIGVLLLWALLFWGGACLPPMTGIFIDAAPAKLKPLASSISMLCFNLLGYALSPLLSGWMMGYFEDKFASCAQYHVGRCPDATKWGFRLVLAWSAVAFSFIIATCYVTERERNNSIDESRPTMKVPPTVPVRKAADETVLMCGF